MDNNTLFQGLNKKYSLIIASIFQIIFIWMFSKLDAALMTHISEERTCWFIELLFITN